MTMGQMTDLVMLADAHAEMGDPEAIDMQVLVCEATFRAHYDQSPSSMAFWLVRGSDVFDVELPEGLVVMVGDAG